MKQKKSSRVRMIRQAVGFGAFVLGVASCESVLDLKHGRPVPPDAPGGEGGAETSGTGGALGGSSGTGGGSSGGGATPSGGSSGSGTAGKAGEGGVPPEPPGGAGGEAGAGASSGAGGSDDGPCIFDDDCPNPDPDCRMECKPRGATTECVAIGADVDDDDHLSAACEANPGDDCDDTKANVYGGMYPAPETCDGLNNDCDAENDLDEFGLSGSVLTILEDPQPADADLSWSESELIWGVLFSSDVGIKYQPMDAMGAMRVDPIPLTSLEPNETYVGIEWGEDAFAVAYGFGGTPDIHYTIISPDGTQLIEPAPLHDLPEQYGAEYPSWLRLGAGRGWAVTWSDYRENTRQVFARTVSPSGELGVELVLGTGELSDFASAGGNVAWVWEGFYRAGALGTDALETAPTDLDLGADPTSVLGPIITSNADRFSVAVRFPQAKIAISEFGVDGSRLCGPVLRDANGFVPGDSVPTVDGFLVFSATPVVQMLEVLPGCRYGRLTPLDTTGARFVRVARRNNGGFAVVWGGYDMPLKGRIFGPNFCD